MDNATIKLIRSDCDPDHIHDPFCRARTSFVIVLGRTATNKNLLFFTSFLLSFYTNSKEPVCPRVELILKIIIILLIIFLGFSKKISLVNRKQ